MGFTDAMEVSDIEAALALGRVEVDWIAVP